MTRQMSAERSRRVTVRNVSKDKSKRERLKRISGHNETPTLVDSSCGVIIAGDEKRSFEHLRRYHRRKNRQRITGRSLIYKMD